MPGVALLDEDQMATTTNLSVTTGRPMARARVRRHLMIDGGMNLVPAVTAAVNNVGVDFVQQVSAKRPVSPPSTGATPAPPSNAVTKSGGNRPGRREFHHPQ